MTSHLPDMQLSRLSNFIATTMGLHFPRKRWKDLERQTNAAAEELGFASAETFLQWLLLSQHSREQIEVLASHLTVSETYFWREPQAFAALRNQILPETIRARETGKRYLRIWSAGCSTGEEAYSIAIMLRELIPKLEDWHITLLATDINPHILRRAAAGVYREWSFRNAPPGFRRKYFHRNDDDTFTILPEIREMVTFSYLNLAEDMYPSIKNNTNAMDLIFCRNVLMYFATERAQQVGQRFYQSLVAGGWLMVGASELSQQLFPQFVSVRLPHAFGYRRETEPPAAPIGVPIEASPGQSLLIPASLQSPSAIAPSSALPARARLTNAIGIASDAPPAPNLALAVRDLADQGKLGEASIACLHAIDANKFDPHLHYLHASILQEQNLASEAQAALKRALYLAPNFVLAHFALANLAQRQGNIAAAKKSFKNVLVLLSNAGPEDILPEAEGLTVGRLKEIIHATIQTGTSTR